MGAGRSGVAALVAQFRLPAGRASVRSACVIARFAVYAVLVAVRAQALSGMLGLLALFGDTVFFLILASFGSGPALWLASLFFLYLLTEALVFYTLARAGGGGRRLRDFRRRSALRSAARHGPTVLVAGALACGFAVSRQTQKRRIESLNEKLAEAQKAADKAREDERQRIASDFHDGPLQSFISLQMRLEILRKLHRPRFRRRHGGPQAAAVAWRRRRCATCARSCTACGRWMWMAPTWWRPPAAPPKLSRRRAASR